MTIESLGLDLSGIPTGALIGGEWRLNGRTFPATSPVTHGEIVQVADCTEADALESLENAVAAFAEWRERTPFERAAVLSSWGRLIDENCQELARLVTLEMGKPIREATGEVRGAAKAIEWTAQEGTRVHGELLPSEEAGRRLFVHRRPVGPVFGITPWNFPVSMVTRKVGPALAAGCTFILKPSEETPLTALYLAQLWCEAGGPPGTLQVLPAADPNAVARPLIEDRRIAKLTFTGSTAVGRALYENAAKTLKRVSLELGGHAPLLVFADADIASAAQGVLAAKYRNGGQTCVSANRFYVEEGVVDSFLKTLADEVSKLVSGDPFDERTDIGPLVNEDAVTKVRSHVDDALSKGAKLVCGGTGEGLYYRPTILSNVNEDMEVFQRETFGPVAPVTAFRSDEEALRLANDTPYGLAAYFWTMNGDRIFRFLDSLEYGIVGANDGRPLQTHVPFGGVKDSGLGREGGRWGVEEYLEVKFASVGWR